MGGRSNPFRCGFFLGLFASLSFIYNFALPMVDGRFESREFFDAHRQLSTESTRSFDTYIFDESILCDVNLRKKWQFNEKNHGNDSF